MEQGKNYRIKAYALEEIDDLLSFSN